MVCGVLSAYCSCILVIYMVFFLFVNGDVYPLAPQREGVNGMSCMINCSLPPTKQSCMTDTLKACTLYYVL